MPAATAAGDAELLPDENQVPVPDPIGLGKGPGADAVPGGDPAESLAGFHPVPGHAVAGRWRLRGLRIPSAGDAQRLAHQHAIGVPDAVGLHQGIYGRTKAHGDAAERISKLHRIPRAAISAVPFCWLSDCFGRRSPRRRRQRRTG